MKIAKIILAGTVALIIIFSSAAFAQQALAGTVTQVDRINRTVAIKQTQSGTTPIASCCLADFVAEVG